MHQHNNYHRKRQSEIDSSFNLHLITKKRILIEKSATCLVTEKYVLIVKTVFLPLTAVFKLQLMSSDRLDSFRTVFHPRPRYVTLFSFSITSSTMPKPRHAMLEWPIPREGPREPNVDITLTAVIPWQLFHSPKKAYVATFNSYLYVERTR